VLLLALAAARSVEAAIIYSGLQELAIPTGFDGVYLDIDTGVTSSTEFAGWDINPFFGGVGVANSPSWQPARVGTGNEDSILRLGLGEIVSNSRLYSTDYGGSDSHLGISTEQFGIGEEGYVGFSFTTNGGAGLYYGWMRVVFTANAGGAMIQDWAYEDSGDAVVTGRVQQSIASGGVKVTTLSPGWGESFTLGSAVIDPGGGNVGSLLKIGAGTTILTSPQTYTGVTAISGGTVEVTGGGILSGTMDVALNTGGTLLFSGAGGLNARLNPAATMHLNGGTLAVSALTSGLDQQFGALTLSLTSTVDFGTGAGGNILRFTDSAAAPWDGVIVLNIWNWTEGVDHLFFGANTSGLTLAQLNAIRFYSDNGATLVGHELSVHFVGSLGEVSPVPEPSSVLTGLAIFALAGWRERRRLRAK
jgi:autotransporter-associated beta strand protein